MVSIIMATYNRAHFIKESLDSILNQTYLNWECLVIDDGGADNTLEVIEPILDRDSRVQYYQRSKSYKKGLPGCRNMGLDICSGNYIVFFDDDDIAHPDLLEISVKQLKSSKTDYCRYLRDVFIDDFNYKFDRSCDFETSILGKRNLEEMITGKIPFNSCQVLWKKSCFSQNRFNEKLMYAEEWECYSRILAEGVKGITIDKVLYFGRKHSNSNTGEFWNEDPVRMGSKVRAIELIIDNLQKNALLSNRLVKYFLRLGFLFKNRHIINYVLNKSNAGLIKQLKYKIGFICYPIIKPILNFKSKISVA